MPIPPEKIIELAQQSGFDSELRVAAIARRAGISARQSVYYIDKDERKGRELDFYIYTSATDDAVEPVVRCVVQLCVEVKKTREPFIFFTSERSQVEPGQAFALIRWLHNVDNNVLSAVSIEKHRPLGSPPRLARSYVGAKGGGTQQIQSGILSAVKAALHFRDECSEYWNENSRDIVFFMPVVVVDGPICECYLDSDTAKFVASEVEEIIYAQNYLSDSYGDVSNQVYVMTLKRFEEVLGSYRDWAQTIMESLIKSRSRTPQRHLHDEVVPKDEDDL